MANLAKAAKEVVGKVEKDKALEQYRRKVSDKQTHIMAASVEGFKASVYLGIQAQRGKKIRISEGQDARVTALVTDYVTKLHRILSGKGTEKFTYTMLGGSPTDFKCRISGDGNVMGHIKRIREAAGLRRVSNGITQVFRNIRLDKGKILFDISHMGTSTVASQYAAAVLAKYESVGLLPQDKQSYEELKVFIRYNPRSSTVAEVEVEDTFWYLNQSTTDEAYVANLLRRAVGNFAPDEFVQGRTDYLSRDLAKVAKKRGAKIKSQPDDPKPGRASTTKKIKHKSPRKPTYSIEKFTGKIEVLEQGGDEQNWSLLIPKINALLHQAVKANMVAPRLVYRTGQFASSVQVTKVETTDKGYPVFSADYERSPYQVFDRVLGRSPWNTPMRDPKDLIQKSVRDVMRTMAIGRFYVKVPGGPLYEQN